MFLITLADEHGKTIDTFKADEYMVLAKFGNQFSKAFSEDDFVRQLGLLGFASAEVNAEVIKRALESNAKRR